MLRRNVFSDKTDISVLVHTQSYLGDDSVFTYFHNADKLERINVSFMPLLYGDASGVPAGEYSHHREVNRTFSIMKCKKCSGVVSIHDMPDPKTSDEQYSILTEEDVLNGRCLSELFDYIVTEVPAPDILDCKIPVISFLECREIIRLQLICCHDYHVSENYIIDETFYYIYRHKYMFPIFQTFWSSCVKAQKLQWADPLDNRLNLMARCLDQCKISAYGRINNSSIMHIKYHLSFLLLLITGSFDNLAWLINDLYNMELDKGKGGNLKIDLKKQAFRDSLKDKSTNIYSFLADSMVQAKLDAIRELRDRIVHRNFLQAYRGGKSGDNKETSYFESDLLFYDKLKKAGFGESNVALKAGGRVLLKMVPFINYIEKIAVEMVDSLLNIITEDIYGETKKPILWELFEFPCEPYVL